MYQPIDQCKERISNRNFYENAPTSDVLQQPYLKATETVTTLLSHTGSGGERENGEVNQEHVGNTGASNYSDRQEFTVSRGSERVQDSVGVICC